MTKERNDLIDSGDRIMTKKNYLKALSCFEEVTDLDPTYRTGWLRKGDALRSLRRFKESINAYDHALVLDPEMALALERK